MQSPLFRYAESQMSSIHIFPITLVFYYSLPIFLDFAEGDINPSNLRGEALSSYEVQLDWSPSQYNCDVIGYRIQVVTQGMMPRAVDVEGGDTSMVVVSMLQPAMRYNFRLSAVTDDGSLPPVSNVTVETPDGPGNECEISNCINCNIVWRVQMQVKTG